MFSDPGFLSAHFPRELEKTLITDFFGSVQGIELTPTQYPLSPVISDQAEPPSASFSFDHRATGGDAILPPPLEPDLAHNLALWILLLLAATVSIFSLL
jgi:hypothetical protein